MVVIYILAGFGLSRIAVNKHVIPKNEITIYILTNGVHTDIVVPVKSSIINWQESILFQHTKGKDTTAKYLALGWGDKGFYLETPTWGDLKFSTVFKAAFALGNSAMHTTYYKKLQENKNCIAIEISVNNYQKLVVYIQNSFKKDSENKMMHINTNANYNQYDAFYEANGSYSLFYTCNTWANNALKACNQKACLWTPYDGGIFYHYQ